MSEEIEPVDVLDHFLFGDIWNNRLGHFQNDWDVTFEGDNYVVLDRNTGDLYHFRVTIEPHEWDSSQAVKDQEWFD